MHRYSESVVFRLVLVWLLVLLAGPAMAQIQPFPHTTVLERDHLSDDDYRVMMGAVNEIGSDLRVESEFRIPVEGEQRLFSVKQGYGLDQVADHYRRELERVNGKILYQCEGLDCGSSNVWAIRVFGKASLYGRDKQQRYTVAAWRDDHNHTRLLLLYLVQRGNREIQVYEQQLKPENGALIPGADLAEKRLLGPFVVSYTAQDKAVSLNLSDAVRNDILELSKRYPAARIALVGHSGLGDASIDTLESQSDAAIDALAGQLTDAGISAARLQSINAGPFMPAFESERQGARVEVLLLREAKE
ncbi:DUF4892 domain-containing protein [Marinobacteraceae bacterium S3BR75-40.1]